MTLFPLAQISTGTGFDPLLNAIFVDYGALPATLVIFAVMALLVWRNRQNANTETTRAINKLATEQTDELNKTNNEFRAYQMRTEKEMGVQEGRITELSRTVKHQQDKYEQQEKAWGETRNKLEAEIERLTKESADSKERLAKLEEELNGKKAELEKVTAERDAHKETVDSLQREKLDKELEIERMRTLILEQENAIKALKQELDGLKTVAIATHDTTPVSEAKAEDNA